jgi:hypothetical protein
MACLAAATEQSDERAKAAGWARRCSHCERSEAISGQLRAHTAAELASLLRFLQ